MSYTVLLQEPIRDPSQRSRIALLAAGQLGITTQQLEALLGRERDSVIARAGSQTQAQQVAQVLINLGVQVQVVEPVEAVNVSQEMLSSNPKTRRGLGRRILFNALAPLLIAGLALAGYLIWTLPSIFDAQLRERALSAAIAGGISITNIINFAEDEPDDLREINRVVRGMARAIPAASFAGVNKGVLIAFENRVDEDDPSYRQEIQTKLRTTSSDTRIAGNTSSTQTAVLNIKGVPYTFGIVSTGSGSGSGRFFVALRHDRMQADLLRTLAPTILAVALAIIITAILALGLISRIVRPITQLTEKANTMSNGDLEQPIIANSNDEIADLSDALERMRGSLKLMMNRSRRNSNQA